MDIPGKILVGVDGRLRRLIGRVRRKRRDIEEQRLRGVVVVMIFMASLPIRGREVAVLLEERAIPLPIDNAAPLLGEIVHFADEVAVEMIEPAAERSMP